MEKTFAMVKPGAVHRGLIGDIIKRFENRGLNIVGLKLIQVSEEQAKQHYQEHLGKDFYSSLVEYITSSPVVVLAISGPSAIQLVRNMAGLTDPIKAQPGTIRGDFSAHISNNIIHTSDSVESANRELGIYFSDQDIIDYHRITDGWSFHI